MSDGGNFRGFIVHSYADLRRNRLFILGRLDDGRSFAVVESRWRPPLHISGEDRDRAAGILGGLRYRIGPAVLESFSGRENLLRLDFSSYMDRSSAARLLENAGIPSPDGGMKPPDAFLVERYVRGPVEIRGASRPGHRLDLVFPDPELSPPDAAAAAVETSSSLRVASIDIETDIHDNSVLAVSIVCASGKDLLEPDMKPPEGLVRVRLPPGKKDVQASAVFHDNEASLLRAFVDDIRLIDPDVLTGWNFLDFDFPRLAARCEHHHIPFSLGRSGEEAKFFPGEGRRSAAAMVPGRQVIDALRIVRAGPRTQETWTSHTLEAVARSVLGEGKLVAASGEEKLAELEKLYREDPGAFGEYCYQDAALVLRILAKTNLWRLTLERASLTGVTVDKAWTSVVSFERIYGMELYRRGIAPPPELKRNVTGAAGGTVLESFSGLFNNIAVFDFRSLYPTIMRTFNVDPLAHARAEASSTIEAPNGAVFSREPGLLPELIAEYFAARRKALAAGDDAAAHVYKILMNSFYGVLGTAACRYGRTELAGAITSFARKWLLLSRDWFNEKGLRVLYGDTDSLFVETGLGDEASYDDFLSFGIKLTGELNNFLTETIRKEYQLESFIELRFEKAYRRFLIPPLRSIQGEDTTRGRAKGYGGFLIDTEGNLSVEIKGMEAVRSDATPLARRLQTELLELVFSGGGEERFNEKVLDTLKDLRQGKLDAELVYRKRLTRSPETYTASTPPQVKAARALGWHNRKGTVEFVWTVSGPAPLSLPHDSLDYDHYADSQVIPLVRSIAAAAGWSMENLDEKNKARRNFDEGQMDLFA
ncbi:DNA polymerase [Spirochaetia bacterium]|nr:DNA polymerase [Spirochaetia bacterium]